MRAFSLRFDVFLWALFAYERTKRFSVNLGHFLGFHHGS
jgi:hypothetical protein